MVGGAAPGLRGPLFLSAAALLLLGWQWWQLGSGKALWLTPAQQAWLAFEGGDYQAARLRFDDPLRIAAAAERAGRYAQAAEAYARVDSAAAHFNRGNVLMRSRAYPQAIAAYERALELAPQWIEARENLALARYVAAYLTQQREVSDAGNEPQTAAPQTRLDGVDERGGEIEITGDSPIAPESAEKWMRTVDTNASEFLRRRFLLEAQRRRAGA